MKKQRQQPGHDNGVDYQLIFIQHKPTTFIIEFQCVAEVNYSALDLSLMVHTNSLLQSRSNWWGSRQACMQFGHVTDEV